MPKLAIPLHDNKTARRTRRAVWKLVGLLLVLGLVWIICDLILTKNTFAQYTPTNTSYTLIIELNQKNREQITNLTGEIQPLINRGLTIGELLPYTKGNLALFYSNGEMIIGLNTTLPENYIDLLEKQDIVVNTPEDGITLLSTKPINVGQVDYKLGVINKINPTTLGYLINHNDPDQQVMTIEERSYGLVIKTGEPSHTATLNQLPENVGLAMAVEPNSEQIEVIEANFTNQETDFVKSMVHELKNYGGAIYTTNISLQEVSFLINRAIPEEIVREIHNYYESGLTADISTYSLPDKSLVYELIKVEPMIEMTNTVNAETNSYETTNLLTNISGEQTLISNSNTKIQNLENLCSSNPSVLIFPQLFSQSSPNLNSSDNLALFSKLIDNFVEVSLDNKGKNQVIRLCF